MQQEIRNLTCVDKWEAARDALKQRIGVDKDGIGILTCMLRSMVYTQENYEKMGIPEQIFVDTMKIFSRFTREHLVSYGRYGFDREFWVGCQLSSVLFRVGALEYELTEDVLPVKENCTGETEEDRLVKEECTGTTEQGQQVKEERTGAAGSDQSVKKECTEATGAGQSIKEECTEDAAGEETQEKEPLIHIHIPSDTILTVENCQESYRLADAFFKKYFPERANDKYACDSWLLSPGLRDLLDEGSNIIRFQNQFEILQWHRDNRAFTEWLFQNRDLSPDEPEKLPERTSLQRKAKAYLMRGGKIGEAYGLLREECRIGK